MDNLFNKALIITDLHFGRSGNSPIANKDNLDFLEWAIDDAKTWGAETCIMMGDWFHNRNLLGVASLHAATRGIEMLSDAFDCSWFMMGNHDCYFRDKRDISSIEFAKHIAKIKVVNDPLTIEDVTFLPWLMHGEHKTLDLKSRYVFGHLELSGFMTNTCYAMPETEESQKASMFKHQDYVFTGHFHKRQDSKNVVYTGNIMPFDFNDDGDPDRGLMLLEYGKEPIFRSWPSQPLYKSLKLSDILADADRLLKQNMTVKVTVDMPLKYEEAQEIKDMLMAAYGLRKIEMGNITEREQEFDNANVQFRTVDQVVIEGLQSVESVELSSDRLVQIYEDLTK